MERLKELEISNIDSVRTHYPHVRCYPLHKPS